MPTKKRTKGKARPAAPNLSIPLGAPRGNAGVIRIGEREFRDVGLLVSELDLVRHLLEPTTQDAADWQEYERRLPGTLLELLNNPVRLPDGEEPVTEDWIGMMQIRDVQAVVNHIRVTHAVDTDDDEGDTDEGK